MKDVAECVEVATHCVFGRTDVAFGRDGGPVQPVAGFARELADEGALGAAITFSEWVGGVQFTEVARAASRKPLCAEASEVAFGTKALQQFASERCDVFVRPEEGALFGNVDRAELAGPRVDFGEKCSVKSLQMSEVVGSWQAMADQGETADKHDVALKEVEFVRIRKSSVVAKDRRAWIAIRIATAVHAAAGPRDA